MSRNADLPFKTAGLEFIEFATQAPAALGQVFASLGFKAIARHVSKDVTLYRQGDMNFLVNAEADSFAHRWAEEYGVGICAIGIRVDDAQHAYDRAVELGAWPAEAEPIGPSELVI
ncbi:4-hydroxyphenylpyruvate dioxygenase, partial [Klebsiella oxytoca]